MSVALLVDSCKRSLPLLHDPAVARRWGEPSALPEWSVGGLAGHFARSAFNLERAVQLPPPTGAEVLDVVDYYTVNVPQPAHSAIGERIRELGDEEAAGGPEALVDRFTSSIARLEHRLDSLPTTVTLFGTPMLLTECAKACLLELLVHADDLALSVDAPVPEFDSEVFDLVAVTLARIGLRRCGAMALVRAFTRPERAPDSIAVF